MGEDQTYEDKSAVRLNKHVAERGFCSRREADRLVQEGKVLVNGHVEQNPARRIDPSKDAVTFTFDTQKEQAGKIYLKLNKPAGYTVSTNEQEGIPVSRLVTLSEKVFPIGRLDKESTGLLLFTNDTALPRKIIGEGSRVEKEYYVKVIEPIPDGALDALRQGVNLWGQKTRPAKVYRSGASAFRIILTEGKNRQIRRMCQKVGYPVRVLKRIRIHTIELGSLPAGRWEYLSVHEIEALQNIK